MNELFKSLSDGLQRSSLASKVTAGLVALAILLAVGLSALVSSRPHLSLLLSGLTDNESAAAMKALAEAEIAFEVSQPPGPFVVYVDEDDRAAALAAIYQSGAMVPLSKGIPVDEGGMSSVFLSNGERQQLSQKRLWGETERMLESLDFVAKAQVQTSTGAKSPFASVGPKRTAAVQLTLRNAHPITDDQATTVVMLVSRGLEIAPEDIVLSDQHGNLLSGAGPRGEREEEIGDWLEYKERYDQRLATKANDALAEILGPMRARVEVDSLWNFEQTTTSSEIVSKGAVRSESKTSSETPIGAAPSGIAGSSSNVDFGTGNAAVPDLTQAPAADAAVAAAAAPVPVPTSVQSEERVEYDPSKSRTETVRTAPLLQRLSVALFLDQSVPAAARADLEEAVKASVGYDAGGRKDVFKTVAIAFAADPAPEGATGTDAPAAAVAAPVEDAEPSAMTRMLLRRGVEVAVALVFIGLLLSSLRSSRKAGAPAARGKAGSKAAVEDDGEVDPELLAQAQVQELLTSDPKRVGEILSQWARSEKAGAA